MNLHNSVNDLVFNLRSRVINYQKIKSPKIEVVFEIKSLSSRFGVNLLHLVAMDKFSCEFIYLAEEND